MNLNQEISTPIAILIIAVIAALAGGVFYWQYKGGEKVEILKEEIDVSDWKTYTDEKNNYRIKYPKDWKLETYSGESSGVYGLARWRPSWVSTDEWNVFTDITVKKMPDNEPVSPDLIFAKEIAKDLRCMSVEINSLEFCKIIQKSKNFSNSLTYAISRDSKLYIIMMSYRLSEREVRSELEKFKKMISTFEFID